MPQSKGEKETVERVMHEFKHGELKGADGKTIRNPKQAVAIGLSEAGASDRVTPEQNRHNRAHAAAAERAGRTGQQEAEGRDAPSHNRSELYAEARKRDVDGGEGGVRVLHRTASGDPRLPTLAASGHLRPCRGASPSTSWPAWRWA